MSISGGQEHTLNQEVYAVLSNKKRLKNHKEDIEENIEELLGNTRNLYWSVLEAQQKNEAAKFKNEYLGVFEKALEYMELSYDGLTKEQSSSTKKEHIYKQPKRKVDIGMKKLFSGLPVVEFQEIKQAWSNFYDLSTPKVFFVLLGAIFNFFLGEFNLILFTFVFMTFAHFIMRVAANKYKEDDDYVGFQKNLQLFLFSYLILAIGKLLSGFVSFDGLPEGTFYALFLLLAIWGELRGFIRSAKIAKFPIHPMLEKITNPANNKSNIDPPF